MTENWATPELTEEQTAEMAKEQAEASETEPAQLNPRAHEDADDPPQIDHRSASERIMEEPEKADTEEENPEVEIKQETKEEDKQEKTVETAVSETTEEESKEDWWEKMSPEDQRKHAAGLQSEVSKLRESRREEREESEQRFKQMMDSVPEQITKAIKDGQPALPEPDPDEDPEGFKTYHAQRTEQAETAAKEAGERAVVSKDDQELLTWMGRQEAEDPEFNDYFKFLFDSMVESKVTQGRSRVAAETETREIGIKVGRALMAEGGNWVKAVKYNAGQAGWKAKSVSETVATSAPAVKSSGEETAATIAAGEKAAKTLGKGGSGASVGELTIEDITNITDPEEHAKAYLAWVDKQTESSSDWKPR